MRNPCSHSIEITLQRECQSTTVRPVENMAASCASRLSPTARGSANSSFAPLWRSLPISRAASRLSLDISVTSSAKYGSPAMRAEYSGVLLKSSADRVSQLDLAGSSMPRKTMGGPCNRADSRNLPTPLCEVVISSAGSASPGCRPCAKYGAGPRSGRTREVGSVVRVFLGLFFVSDVDDALLDVIRGWPSLKRIHFAPGNLSALERKSGELRSQLNLSRQARARHSDPRKSLASSSYLLRGEPPRKCVCPLCQANVKD